MSPKKCIYCGEREVGSSEHILQNSFGAQKEDKRILCKDCNILFGNTIDNILGEDFKYITSYLGIPGKKKEPSDLKVKSEKFGEVTRDGVDASFTSGKPNVEQIKEGEKTVFHVVTPPVYYDHILDSIRKGHPGLEWTIQEQFKDYIAKDAGKITLGFKFSLLGYIGIYKSLMNLCALCFDPSNWLCMHRRANELYKFCKKIEIAPDNAKELIDLEKSKSLFLQPHFKLNFMPSVLNQLFPESVYQHMLYCSSNKTTGDVWGAAILFGSFEIGFKLFDNCSEEISCFLFSDAKLGYTDFAKHPDRRFDLTEIDFQIHRMSDSMNYINMFMTKIAPGLIRADELCSIESVCTDCSFDKFGPIPKKALLEILSERFRILLNYHLTLLSIPQDERCKGMIFSYSLILSENLLNQFNFDSYEIHVRANFVKECMLIMYRLTQGDKIVTRLLRKTTIEKKKCTAYRSCELCLISNTLCYEMS